MLCTLEVSSTTGRKAATCLTTVAAIKPWKPLIRIWVM
jgi:hypothetical protein